MDDGVTTLATADGRDLEVLVGGAPDGFPWLLHGGSPSAVVPYEPFAAAATAHGLRLITYSRPGYGASTRRPREHPRFVDDLDDTVTVLDALGADRFVTLGWSGGGPRALACATELGGRCLAAATLAGVAPKDGDGLDWFAGMGEENLHEYAAASRGIEAYTALADEEFLPLSTVTADQIAESLGGLVTPVDKAFTNGAFADYLAAMMRGALAQGVGGLVDDGLAAVAPWGFDLDSITVPVAVWQGRQDAMVPFTHGQWLADHVPSARAHLYDDEGHLSLVDRMPEILADLRALAGL